MNIIFDIENKDRIKQLIFKINSSRNIEITKPLVKELYSITKGYPCCKLCGEPLYYELMYFKIINNNELQILVPRCFEHEYGGIKYKLDKCYGCVKEHFGDDMPSMQRYLFQVRYRWARWIYEIPEDVHEKIRSDKCGVTLESLINKWGKEDGEKRWKEYCRKQGEVNTFEYKQKKFGWTKEQFDNFNKSRACTIENLIDRYGEKNGKEKWQSYLDKQHKTKTWEYMVEKFGEEHAREINSQKALTLPNFIRKYGEELGKENYLKWLTSAKGFGHGYSEISQSLFNKLKNILSNYDMYYATNRGEYKLDYESGFYLLDFYIPSIKLCLEFDGDYFHANPKIFSENDYPHPFNKNLIAKEIWERDKERQAFIESRGIKVVRIWESEYKAKDFNIHKFIKEQMGIELNTDNN